MSDADDLNAILADVQADIGALDDADELPDLNSILMQTDEVDDGNHELQSPPFIAGERKIANIKQEKLVVEKEKIIC